jgi:hypothetical protein
MAEHGALDAAATEAANFAEREAMYRRFLTIIKYSVAAIVIVLVLMAVFLM